MWLLPIPPDAAIFGRGDACVAPPDPPPTRPLHMRRNQAELVEVDKNLSQNAQKPHRRRQEHRLRSSEIDSKLDFGHLACKRAVG